MNITYKGENYKSQSEVAIAFGIKKSTFNGRLLRGMSIAEAIEFDGRNKIKEVEYKGKTYSSIYNLASILNIRPEYLYGRIKKGMSVNDSVDEALKMLDNKQLKIYEPEPIKNETGIIVWNIRYNSTEEIKKEYNINNNIFNKDMKSEDIEKAILTYMKPVIEEIEKSSRSTSALARACGVQPDTVYQRLKLGWNITEAVVIPLRNRHKSQITYKGKKFISRANLASYYNIDSYYVFTLSSRLDKSWIETFKIVEEFASEHKLTQYAKPPRVLGPPYQLIFDGVWFDAAVELANKYGLDKIEFLSMRGSERFEYIKEFAGEPSGPCFDYKEEWDKMIEGL